MIDTMMVVLPNGDLKLMWFKEKASADEVEAVRAIIDTGSEYQATVQLFEADFCGDFSWIEPEQIPGALTSAPIICADNALFADDWLINNAEGGGDASRYLELDEARALINALVWRLNQGGRRLEWYEDHMLVSGLLWYYERYQVESFLEVLYEHGEVIFDKVRTEEAN